MDHRGTSTAQRIDRRQTGGATHGVPAGLANDAAVEIANWLRAAADLQNLGRDVAKERDDSRTIARLTESLGQRDRPAGQSVSGRALAAEGWLNVTGASLISPTSSDLAASDFAASVVARPAGAADRHIAMAANCVGALNIKLTAVAAAVDATAQKPRTTNLSSGDYWSGWLWNVTPLDGVIVDGVVTHPGSSCEFSDACF